MDFDNHSSVWKGFNTKHWHEIMGKNGSTVSQFSYIVQINLQTVSYNGDIKQVILFFPFTVIKENLGHEWNTRAPETQENKVQMHSQQLILIHESSNLPFPAINKVLLFPRPPKNMYALKEMKRSEKKDLFTYRRCCQDNS